jgi:hypothetical protein
LLGAYFAAESLAGGLPGYAQGGGYPVPAPPVRPGQRHALGEQCLISPGALGGFGDGTQVGEVFNACRFRVEFIGQCLEPARRFLDLGICVLHVITSSSKEPVEPGLQR